MKFTLDRRGGAEVLKKLVADEISALTRRVAANAGDAAQVDETVTDRAKGLVMVPAALQAKNGTLTRAAAAAGLEVRSK